MDWFSESSDDDSDDGRPVSSMRTDTQFYQGLQNGEYGDDWPPELMFSHAQSVQNGAAVVNGQANASFANNTLNASLLDASRIISPSQILSLPEDIAFVDEGGKFRPVRIIKKEEIDNGHVLVQEHRPQPHLNQHQHPNGRPNHEHRSNLKVEDEEIMQPVLPPKIIPLEPVDLVDFPKDPRVRTEDEYDSDPEDRLIIPRFYLELRVEEAIRNNQQRKHKQSNSYVRERILQQSQRQAATRRDPRLDPRLEKTLFGEPKKVDLQDKNQFNMSLQNPPTVSMFDDPEEMDEESMEFSASSSPSSSFSMPSPVQNLSNSFNDNKMNDSSDSDNVHTFAEFQKRKNTTNGEVSANKPKRTSRVTSNDKKASVPNKKAPPANKKKSPKSTLFDKKRLSTTINKEDILSALTDDTASEDQENIQFNVKEPESRPTGTERKPKVQAKRKTAPIKIRGYHPNMYMFKQEAPSNEYRDLKITAPIVADNASTSQKAGKVIKISSATDTEPSENTEEINGFLPNESQSSASLLGSIEEQLAAMTSPVKPFSQVCADSLKGMLTDILSDTAPNATVTSDASVEMTRSESNVAEPMKNTIGDNVIPKAVESLDLQPEVESPAFECILPSNDKNTGTSEKTLPAPVPIPVVVNTVTIGLPNLMDDFDVQPTKNASVPQIINQTAEKKDLAECETPSDLGFELPDIGANAEIFGMNENINIAEYARDLDTSTLDDMVLGDMANGLGDGAKPKKPERCNIIFHDLSEFGHFPAAEMEMSDDDFEEDKPCGMDDLFLPNASTAQNKANKKNPNCGLCAYQAVKGWKQLTKHQVRQHPGKEIESARLAKEFNVQELQTTTFEPIISNGPAGTLIKSLCYMCNEYYNMCSSKWLMHFIAHTGGFEYRCNVCKKEIVQDLHKQCNSKDNERINGPYDFADNTLYGYVCLLCNYVQLSETGIKKHLDEHHQLSECSEFNEIVLLKSNQILDLLHDDKQNAELTAAKINVEATKTQPVPDADESLSAKIIDICDDDDDDDALQTTCKTIDLTLSDDDDF